MADIAKTAVYGAMGAMSAAVTVVGVRRHRPCWRLSGRPVSIGASVGVVAAPPGAEPEAELRRADDAMYAAKAAGRGCARVAG